MNSKHSVLLTGLKHSGKSTVGYKLSEILNSEFQDIDSIIERIYYQEKKEIATARQVYERCGREGFLEYEQKAVKSLSSATRNGAQYIIAAGGGICDNDSCLEELKETCTNIFLDETPEILYERIIAGGIPAFLDQEKPYEHFLQLSKDRQKKYRNNADIVLALNGAPADRVIKMALKSLQEFSHGWK